MDICVFAGTFNPIHNAHIKMAEIALNKNNFDKIIFIPSYIPPHKDVEKDLAIHRMNMVKLATKYNPKFEVSDFEYKNENKSYSIFTVKEIIKKYDIKEKLNNMILITFSHLLVKKLTLQIVRLSAFLQFRICLMMMELWLTTQSGKKRFRSPQIFQLF